MYYLVPDLLLPPQRIIDPRPTNVFVRHERMAVRSSRFILLLQLLIVLTLAYQLSLLLRPENAFLSRPYIEDSFYALSVARSIAQGNGFSVDGLHATNGVQPLICLLDAPAFMVAGDDAEAALRLTYVLAILLYLFAAWMIAGFARQLYRGREGKEDGRLVFWGMFALVYVNYVISVYYLNGLETGLAGGLVFAAFWLYLRTLGDTTSTKGGRLVRYGLLGVLLGLGVLARIDISLLVVALILSHFIRAHLLYSRSPGRERWNRFLQTTAEAFVVGAVAVLVSSPWWVYNYTTFGSLMPVSGQSQQWLSQRPLDSVIETFNVLSDALLPGVHTPQAWRVGSLAPYGILLFPLGLLLFSLFPGVRRGLGSMRSRLKEDWNLSGFLPLAIFSLILIVFYTFFFRAPHFQARYLMVPTLAIMLGLFAFFWTLRCQLEPGTAGRTLLPILLLLPMLLFFPFFSRNFEESYYNLLAYPALWIGENVPPGEKVGMFQSGTAGFVHPDVVVNLDGKVNAAAWTAYRNGRLPHYVDSVGFDYIIDWNIYTDRIFSDPALRAQYQRIDTLPWGVIVWKRIGK